jgi:signal transduction histidine kinase
MTDEQEGRLARFPVRLPPLRRPAFWAVQGLVLLIAVAHTSLETIGRVELPEPLYLIPSSMFFIPVVYAALTFGGRAAIATALWAIALTLPNLIWLHSGYDRLGVMWQGVILLAIAVFVGYTVDHEREAREEVEAREAARLASETRYRALFDRASEAVLVLDATSRVDEANAAAGRLLGRAPSSLRGLPLAEAVGAELAAALTVPGAQTAPRPLQGPAGTTVWVQPVPAVPLASGPATGNSQVMLHDVTLQYERQQGLEGWTRHAITAREQERRRMGREIHDGPVQSLVLLSRKLDAIDEGADRETVIEDAREIIDQTAADLRRLSKALRPTILDDLGLVAALRSETNALGRRAGIQAHFDVVGDPRPLAEDTELLLLRVAQEGLHNVERHARASRVVVSVCYEADRVSVEVADNGRGIGRVPTTTKLLADNKLGLVGMQERIRLAEGVLQITDSAAGGTILHAEVPASPRLVAATANA